MTSRFARSSYSIDILANLHFNPFPKKRMNKFRNISLAAECKIVNFEENCTEFAIFIRNFTMVHPVLRCLAKRYLHGRERNGGIQWTNLPCLDHFIHHLRRFVWGSRGPFVGRLMNEVCYCWVFIGFPGRWSFVTCPSTRSADSVPFPPVNFHETPFFFRAQTLYDHLVCFWWREQGSKTLVNRWKLVTSSNQCSMCPGTRQMYETKHSA